jgi:hypothetical protein
MLVAKLHFDIASLTLGLNMAPLSTITASLVPSQKLCEILREIVIKMPQGYSLLAPVRPESMHIFYAASAISAIATQEMIRLLIQIPLKTDGSTYSVYDTITITTFEPTSGKFVKIYVADGRRLAVSVDRRSHMELTCDYRQNCRLGRLPYFKATRPFTSVAGRSVLVVCFSMRGISMICAHDSY